MMKFWRAGKREITVLQKGGKGEMQNYKQISVTLVPFIEKKKKKGTNNQIIDKHLGITKSRVIASTDFGGSKGCQNNLISFLW